MILLKQSTASQEIPLGYFVDSADGNSEETGLTIANTDIKIWKNGASTLANKNSGGATHISNGIYYATLDATDTDTLGPLVIFVHVSGALTVRQECLVLAANVYDSLVAASDKLQVDAVEVSGDSTAADNLEAACDGNSYNLGGGAVVAASVTGNVGGSVGSVAAGGITAASIASGAIDADALAADAVDEILDEVVEGTLTMRQVLKILLAALAGKASGGGTTTIAFRDNADTKDRISMTVDSSGNRTAVSLDGA